MQEYWNDNSGKEKLLIVAYAAGGTILFCLLPGVVLGLFAAAVVLGCIITGLKSIL